ncbi:hypothetical protein [Methylotenera versatilis]|uniref:hypothetical protein n=1 Tax=Methylotenera versatilis TaxID=1055487 RepID=UPI000647ADB2|nr:hypothetical protein [Methylotenera versatilis]
MRITDKRVIKNSSSVRALRTLLVEVMENPKLFVENKELISSLKCQGKLSKFEDANKGITKSSLNTLKRISDEILVGGFSALNQLRIEALYLIEKEMVDRKKSYQLTKHDLKNQISEKEAYILKLKEELLILTMIVEKLIFQGKNYALKTQNPSLIALCGKEQREILEMLSFSQSQENTNIRDLRA